MSRKEEIAKRIADQATEWFRDRVRAAYLRGWEDAEKNMYDKADALLEVLKNEAQEEE